MPTLMEIELNSEEISESKLVLLEGALGPYHAREYDDLFDLRAEISCSTCQYLQPESLEDIQRSRQVQKLRRSWNEANEAGKNAERPLICSGFL
jgi:hypothetical protein